MCIDGCGDPSGGVGEERGACTRMDGDLDWVSCWEHHIGEIRDGEVQLVGPQQGSVILDGEVEGYV